MAHGRRGEGFVPARRESRTAAALATAREKVVCYVGVTPNSFSADS
jgi:hypothetical protein